MEAEEIVLPPEVQELGRPVAARGSSTTEDEIDLGAAAEAVLEGSEQEIGVSLSQLQRAIQSSLQNEFQQHESRVREGILEKVEGCFQKWMGQPTKKPGVDAPAATAPPAKPGRRPTVANLGALTLKVATAADHGHGSGSVDNDRREELEDLLLPMKRFKQEDQNQAAEHIKRGSFAPPAGRRNSLLETLNTSKSIKPGKKDEPPSARSSFSGATPSLVPKKFQAPALVKNGSRMSTLSANDEQVYAPYAGFGKQGSNRMSSFSLTAGDTDFGGILPPSESTVKEEDTRPPTPTKKVTVASQGSQKCLAWNMDEDAENEMKESSEADDDSDSDTEVHSGQTSENGRGQGDEPFTPKTTEPDIKICCKGPRVFLERIIYSFYYDCLIGLLVIVNAGSIGAQADYHVQNLGEPLPWHFIAANLMFCMIFAVEISIRLFVDGPSWFFRGDECKWNIFDVVCVCLQIAEEFFDTVIRSDNDLIRNVTLLRLIRTLRLVRIIRVIRLLRFINELRTMVFSIAASLRYLCWTIVLVFMIIYVVGVWILQLLAGRNLAPADRHTLEGDARVDQYFGSLLQTLLSLFQAMTGGIDWSEMLSPLMDHISPWMALAFVVYIAFVLLAMMNIITGIFVESALQTAKEDRESDLMVQLRHAFVSADLDGSGMLTWEEFSDQLSTPDMVKYFKALDIDTSEARGLFTLLDTGNKGMIDAEAFVMGCLQLRGGAKSIDLATMMYFNKRMAKLHIDHMNVVEEELEFLRQCLVQMAESGFGGGHAIRVSSTNSGGGGFDGVDEPFAVSEHRGSAISQFSVAVSENGSSISKTTSGVLERSTSMGSSVMHHLKPALARGDSRMNALEVCTWADLKAEGSRRAKGGGGTNTAWESERSNAGGPNGWSTAAVGSTGSMGRIARIQEGEIRLPNSTS